METFYLTRIKNVIYIDSPVMILQLVKLVSASLTIGAAIGLGNYCLQLLILVSLEFDFPLELCFFLQHNFELLYVPCSHLEGHPDLAIFCPPLERFILGNLLVFEDDWK